MIGQMNNMKPLEFKLLTPITSSGEFSWQGGIFFSCYGLGKFRNNLFQMGIWALTEILYQKINILKKLKVKIEIHEQINANN